MPRPSDRDQNVHSQPTGVCSECRGLKECFHCNNDAFCTKCACDPKRTPGTAVRYIIRTNSFIDAQELSIHEPNNRQIVSKEGAISKDVTDPDDRRLAMARSSLIKVAPIPAGHRLEHYYSFSKSNNLGKGSYGTVSKVRCLYSENVRALKVVLKSKIENITRLKREILIMKRLDHPGIIRLHEVFEDETNLYLVMELCTGGELFDRVIKANKFSEQYSSRLIKQVLSVLAYIHANDIIHRDLKPENLLYIDHTPGSRIKVIDWGFALKCDRRHSLTSVVGTPYYVAPEVLNGNYSIECDLWSTGVILFIMLCGYPPFYGADNKEILKKVRQGDYTFEPKHWSGRSKSVKGLLTMLLTYNPKERISAKDALTHEWIRYFEKIRQDEQDPTGVQRVLTPNQTLSPRLASELLFRFRTFAYMNPIKRLAVTATAYMLSGKDLGHSTVIFDVLDKNCDGVLTKNELQETFDEMGFDVPDLDKVLELMDTDGNGTIDYTEFLASTMDSKLYTNEKLARVAFRVFDVNYNGEISCEEIMRALEVNTGNTTFTKARVMQMMAGLSVVPGILTFSEFYRLLQTEEKTQRMSYTNISQSNSVAPLPKTANPPAANVQLSNVLEQRGPPPPSFPLPPTISSRGSDRAERNVPSSHASDHSPGHIANIEPTSSTRTRKSPLLTTYNKARTLLRNRSTKYPAGDSTGTNAP